ncbi:MAG: hypothetical protein ACOC57_07890 [Acidobacteriota bacterium]
MACCAAKKQKKQFLIFSLLLFIVTAVSAVIFLIPLSVGALFSSSLGEKKRRGQKSFATLLKGLWDKILTAPFLLGSDVRCRLSGRLITISPALAGFFYRFFNLIILGLLSSIIVAAVYI